MLPWIIPHLAYFRLRLSYTVTTDNYVSKHKMCIDRSDIHSTLSFQRKNGIGVCIFHNQKMHFYLIFRCLSFTDPRLFQESSLALEAFLSDSFSSKSHNLTELILTKRVVDLVKLKYSFYFFYWTAWI